MKNHLLVLFISLSTASTFAQSLIESYPKTFTSSNDSISIEYSIVKGKKFKMQLIVNDTISPGTDGGPNISTKVWIGKDSLSLIHKSFPYAQKTFVSIQTPKGLAVVALRYNAKSAFFDTTYIQQHQGSILIEHPEVYELANIIWALSPSGARATDLNTQTEYYKRVKEYFAPYGNHPIFQKLNFADSLYSNNYYDFRENSYTFCFKGNKIVPHKNYFYVMGDDWDSFTNLFKTLVPLVEDFAKQSNFKKFYNQNKDYYEQQTDRLKTLLPIQNMWTWLEKEFPDNHYQSYKIVYSPLIGGSHSTQNYTTFISMKERFSETVMFICDAEKFDANPNLTEEQKKGLMSGIVFTEIDHNYVNPVSNQYKKEINNVFGNKEEWSKNSSWYSNPMAIFNEYMTHSVFCLWVKEYFDPITADYVINAREDLNINKRGFFKFKDFNQQLLQLHKDNPELKVKDLFSKILGIFKAVGNRH